MSLVTAAQMRGLLIVAEGNLSEADWKRWEDLMIEPEVWNPPADADYGFGYWVVGIKDDRAIWYNSVADCFQCNRFSQPGQLDAPSRERGDLAVLIDSLTGEAPPPSNL